MDNLEGKRILVVDDSGTMRMLIAVTIKKLSNSVTVTEAADGFAALEKFRRQDFDLVLTDFNMPGMNGDELIRSIRQLSGDIPIAVITTKGEEKDRDLCLSAGANGYLTKPVKWHELHEVVKRLLANGEVSDARCCSNTACG